MTPAPNTETPGDGDAMARTDPSIPLAARLISLEDHVALVTGAGRGLGLEVARALASAGALVVVAGRDLGRLVSAVRTVESEGGRAEAVEFDLDDPVGAVDVVRHIEARHGRLDILVANAGTRSRSGFAGLTRDSLTALLQTNLVGTTELAVQAGRLMAAGQRGGRIVIIGSVMSSLASAIDPGYQAAKSGLTGMMRALAAELGPDGITVNEVAPGSFATEFNQDAVNDPAVTRHVRSRTLLRRWGEPEEIAGSVLFLASPGASYVTGHRLVVDGGFSVKA